MGQNSCCYSGSRDILGTYDEGATGGTQRSWLFRPLKDLGRPVVRADGHDVDAIADVLVAQLRGHHERSPNFPQDSGPASPGVSSEPAGRDLTASASGTPALFT